MQICILAIDIGVFANDNEFIFCDGDIDIPVPDNSDTEMWCRPFWQYER